MNIKFYFGQDAQDIRNRKKAVAKNHQIIYGSLVIKMRYKLAPQFFNCNCFKIGKTHADSDGYFVRESGSNQVIAADHTNFICVLPVGVDHSMASRIEHYARELMRGRNGFQNILAAVVIKSSGREWTAWDNEYLTEDDTSKAFEQIFNEDVTEAYEEVMGTKPSITVDKPFWESTKTSQQRELSDELAAILDNVITKCALLISLPTGTGKEPLTLEMLLSLQKKMNKEKGVLNVLWHCPSPLNDIISEVRKWNEFYCGISVYTRTGDKLSSVHRAAAVERIRLVVVSLPSLKAPDRLKVADNSDDLEDADYDAGLSEEEDGDLENAVNNTINALKDFKKEHGSFDVRVQDESHEGYDTLRTGEAYNRLKAEGIVDDSVVNIRKSATDFDEFVRAARSGSPVIHRSIAELTPQMVAAGRWPAQKLVVLDTLMRTTLESKGWSKEDIEAQMASKNPRDWKPGHCEAFLEALIYQVPAKDWTLLPPTSREKRIRKLYNGNQGVFLLQVAHVADGDALSSTVSTEEESCGDGTVLVGKVGGQPVAFVKAYGSNRSCKTERDLNDIIERQLSQGRHIFILTCGAFCQGNNIPKLDAAVLVRRLKSRKRLVQFKGRLNRSRGILNDVKYFVVLDEEAGIEIQLDAAVEEYEDKEHSGTPTDLKSIAIDAQNILPMYNFCDSGWKICEKRLSDEWTELLKQKIETKWDDDKNKYHETLESNTAIGAAALSKNKPQNILLPGIGSGEESDIPEYREPRPAPSPKDLAKQAEKDKKTRRARANDLVVPIFKCARYATQYHGVEVKCKDQLNELFKDKWEEYLPWFEAEAWFKKNKTTAEEVLAVIHEINECWLGTKLSKDAAPTEYTQELKDRLRRIASRATPASL